MNRIRSITPTVCGLAQIPPPSLSSCEPLSIVEIARRQFAGRAAQRMFIFCPDALGKHLWSTHRADWEPVHRHAPNIEELRAEHPSVTPVCFASMFTGTAPEEHGITKYEKPVLRCDTVFDALARAGRRVAIVAVKGSSIDTIFRGRNVDYFSEDYDPQVTARAEALIDETVHDVILATFRNTTIHSTAQRHFQKKRCRPCATASPILADGKIYVTTEEEGVTTVFRAGPKFEVLASNRLADDCSPYCLSTVAVSDGQLFLRTSSYLWMIGERKTGN